MCFSCSLRQNRCRFVTQSVESVLGYAAEYSVPSLMTGGSKRCYPESSDFCISSKQILVIGVTTTKASGKPVPETSAVLSRIGPAGGNTSRGRFGWHFASSSLRDGGYCLTGGCN